MRSGPASDRIRLADSDHHLTRGRAHRRRPGRRAARGHVLELVPNQRLRWTDAFEDPNLPGEMTFTVNLKQVSVGTELHIVQEGLPDAISPDACTLDWQESLALLAKLVEAEIPD